LKRKEKKEEKKLTKIEENRFGRHTKFEKKSLK